jgi:hypothetical protein
MFVIIWQPDAVTEEQYAELIVALGNIVRKAGGKGVKRIKTEYDKGLVTDTYERVEYDDNHS